MIKPKKMATDLIYSITAVGIMNVVVQFLVYPIINKQIGAASFGDMLFFLGIVNVLAPSFGIAANNSRLLLPDRDSIKNGDYGIVMLCFFGIALVVGLVVSIYRGISWLSALLFIYIIVITMLRNYSCVEFRLSLNYKRQFFFYVILSIGYIVGMLPLLLGSGWEVVFILGETIAVGFVVLRGSIFKRIREHSNRFKEALKNSFTLSVNYLITNLMLNLDRMVLLNFVNNEAVSQYYVLSLMGKTISIISGPLNGILIGYLTKGGEKISRKNYLKAGGLLLGVGALFLLACSVATPIFIKIMYPDLYTSVISLNFIVNLSQIIYFLTGILVVIVLTVSTPKHVLRNQIIYSVVFIVLSVVFTRVSAITGFAYAAVISNTIYFALMYFTGLRATKAQTLVSAQI